jgi:hypothetical protein
MRVCDLTLALAWASALLAPSIQAQGYRGWASTSVQVVELRPLGLDEERTLAATQDVSLTAWGFGVEGLSATTLLRFRAHAGSDVLWPRADDEFDMLVGYAQYQRGALRVRGGRLELRGGLGFTGFDGASASYALGSWRGEVYGGRSLARGLSEPPMDEARGLEGFYEDRSAVLMGGSVTGRWRDVDATARYDREILSDRSSYVGERVSLDVASIVRSVRVRASVDYDISFLQLGKGQVSASKPLDGGRWVAELSGVRYIPYFELATIWGFFQPVAYHEVMGRLSWSPRADLGLWLAGGWRAYSDTETVVVFEPMRDTGWRADAGGTWMLAPDWSFDGNYQLEWGPGGFLNSGDATLRYGVTERLSLALTGMTFQQIMEYRLGDGRAYGARASVDFRWWRATFAAGASLLRHRDGGTDFTSPWNQGRAWTSVTFDIGSDPGLANRGRRP